MQVRFAPDSDRIADIAECPSRADSVAKVADESHEQLPELVGSVEMIGGRICPLPFRSRKARGGHGRRVSELCEASEVLGDCPKHELVLGSSWAAQPKPVEP